MPHHIPIRRLAEKALPVAAAFLLASGASLLADEHWLPVPDDPDNDYLSYREEILLGTYDFYFDFSTADSIAKSYKTIIDSLPREVSDTTCYAVDNFADGLYTCPICGEEIDMGFVTIHNPLRNLEKNIPYMALHFMEHGSFSYIIEEDTSRVDIESLKEVLAPFDTQHLVIETQNDSDDDGLNYFSELHFNTDPANPETHNLGIDDGQEITEAIIEHISDLPAFKIGETPPTDQIYIIYDDYVEGYENCNICGKSVLMGTCSIINPLNGVSVESLPIISLHYMAHGRFAYSGTTHEGEADPIELATVLDIDLAGIGNLPEIAAQYGYQLINFPNPFTGSTTISFCNTEVTKPTEIKVYNLKGQLVKELGVRSKGLGVYEAIWDGRDANNQACSSGIYFVNLELDGVSVETQKVLLVR